MKFRKKPIVIDALLNSPDVPWSTMHDFCPTAIALDNHRLMIPTLEGQMQADVMDWIIKGVKGEFYPCKPDIFDATYERVEEPPCPTD